MRIVQTFWTAGRDPLKHPFGWAHPEYNLMSWALSCLSLREHYDEVALYTDREGYDVLINKLHLPYTEVNVVYDENLCLPHHWAYAKIKTYSMQKKPFLHVDGDVYLPQPVPEDILNAPLIAQNREIGTCYYRSMIDRMLSFPEIFLPEYIQSGLTTQSIASYNMGIFGGNDIDFIQRYCQEVENFMQTNNMNDSSMRCSRARCNIFFEQVYMAIMAEQENNYVASLHENAVKDKGYSSREFCDFENFEKRQLLHVLGGHKKISHNFELLEKTMLRLHEEYFTRIIHLFKTFHKRLSIVDYSSQDFFSVERSIAQYEDTREKKAHEWDLCSIDDIIKTDKSLLRSHGFIMASPEECTDYLLSVHPHLYVYELPKRWHPKAIELMKQRLKCEKEYPLYGICLFPILLRDGLKEVPIIDLQYKIISSLSQTPMFYSKMEEEIICGFTLNSEKSRSGARKLIHYTISNLVRHGVIIANQHK